MDKRCRSAAQIVLASLYFAFSPVVSADEPGFSFGLGIGRAQFDLNEPNLVNGYSQLSGNTTFTDDATAFNLFGGMQLDQYLSLEMALTLAGNITAKESNNTIKLFSVSGFAITGMLSKPIHPRVNLFGRVGANFWSITEDASSDEDLNSSLDLTYGLGADINIYGDESRQFRIEWNRYHYDDVFIKTSDTFSASLIFFFERAD